MAKKIATRKRVAKKKQGAKLPKNVTTWQEFFAQRYPQHLCGMGERARAYATQAEAAGQTLKQIWDRADEELQQLAAQIEADDTGDGLAIDYALRGEIYDSLDIDEYVEQHRDALYQNTLAPNVQKKVDAFEKLVKAAGKTFARLQTAYDDVLDAEPKRILPRGAFLVPVTESGSYNGVTLRWIGQKKK